MRKLNDIESIKKRPSMYIGYTDQRGIYNMIFDIIEAVLDSSSDKSIYIKILDNNKIELFSQNCNMTFDRLEINIVKALSEIFNLENSNGFKIAFKPSTYVFSNIHLDYYVILDKMIELATINFYKIELVNDKNYNTISFPKGIENIFEKNNILSDQVVYVTIQNKYCNGEIIVSYNPGGYKVRTSYVNNIQTYNGSAEIIGVFKALKNVVKKAFEQQEKYLTIEDISYVINLKLDNPTWQGDVKRKIINKELVIAIQNQVEIQLCN